MGSESNTWVVPVIGTAKNATSCSVPHLYLPRRRHLWALTCLEAGQISTRLLIFTISFFFSGVDDDDGMSHAYTTDFAMSFKSIEICNLAYCLRKTVT